MNNTKACFAVSLLLATAPNLVTAAAVELHQNEMSETQLTLYQQNTSLVQATYPLTKASASEIRIQGLPSSLLPASVLLNGLDTQQILWSASINSYQQALTDSIGKTIKVVHIETGLQVEYQLEAITPPYMQVVRDGQISQLPLDGPWLPSISFSRQQDKGLLTLRDLEVPDPASENFSLTYLASNLGWSPEYTIELIDDARIELKARALLRNDTEADFLNAKLDLLAGKPDMPVPTEPQPRFLAMAADMQLESASAVETAQGYYLFKLPDPVDLPANTHKRVPLLAPRTLDAEISYRHSQSIYAGLRTELSKEHARQWLAFTLPESISDSPLPQGTAQLYRRDADGQIRFIGSQMLSDSSPGQRVEFAFGDAFDLKINQRQTDYKRTGQVYRQSYEVRISNGGLTNRSIEYSLNFRQPWTMIDSSALVTTDGMEARWLVEIPARSEVVISYTVDLSQS